MFNFKIAKKVSLSTKNNLTVDALDLTFKTDDPVVIRTYKLLWERAKSMKPSTVFDPLNLFESDEVGLSHHLVKNSPALIGNIASNASNICENSGNTGETSANMAEDVFNMDSSGVHTE